MFLRQQKCRKNGKDHFYWSIVENKRVAGGRVLQRHVLYLGELNATQEASWRKSVDLFFQENPKPQQVMLFAEDHMPAKIEEDDLPIVGVRLSQMRLGRPRQWRACWLGCELWSQLELDQFWKERLPIGRKGARWNQILQTLALYRLLDPGSEWRLHRHWFEHSALADLLALVFTLRFYTLFL